VRPGVLESPVASRAGGRDDLDEVVPVQQKVSTVLGGIKALQEILTGTPASGGGEPDTGIAGEINSIVEHITTLDRNIRHQAITGPELSPRGNTQDAVH
jgi:hypothetical protein